MIVLFEGMDGAGKSSLIEEIWAVLNKRGDETVTRALPSNDHAIGRFLRESIFTGDVTVAPEAMMHLMVADALDCDGVVEALSKKCHVLLDRHPMVSAWAYQVDDTPIEVLASATAPHNFTAQPDLIFILDVPPEVAMERRKKRGLEDNPLFEKDLEHARTLRCRYAAWAERYEDRRPVVCLDGTLTIGELVKQVLEIMDVL